MYRIATTFFLQLYSHSVIKQNGMAPSFFLGVHTIDRYSFAWRYISVKVQSKEQ